MVDVVLWSSLRRFADDKTSVEVDADTVGGILSGLIHLHPALKPHIERGVSVSVDGTIIASGRNEPVAHDSEVVLLQRIKGG
ncbi:MAG: MoaD/ThiS family protein [Rhodobacteraceae bacterium]|nr:MoaD/ThiS family protein [Paracoccaceae bacterium]MCY4197880.1 MoaD/ThiS family protein [Paracoccaceae bacterium]MCY4326861.1 MoaD/ThiS family protein [Paracoccaceae bacterium]